MRLFEETKGYTTAGVNPLYNADQLHCYFCPSSSATSLKVLTRNRRSPLNVSNSYS